MQEVMDQFDIREYKIIVGGDHQNCGFYKKAVINTEVYLLFGMWGMIQE